MKPLSGDEYNNVFDVTGMDVDGRREMLQKFFLPNMEACIKRFVNFVKAIPGFTQLPLCDQIALVKGILVLFIVVCLTLYITMFNNVQISSLRTITDGQLQ